MILILGAGYAGLNAYYNIKSKEKVIISENDYFTFYTAFLRNIIEKKKYTTQLNFVKKEKIIDIDMSNLRVKTDKNIYEPDKLIIALGCKNRNLNKFLELRKMDNLCISSEDKYDSYLALQTSFYAKMLGKNVKYGGNYMEWLGDKIGNKIRKVVDDYLGTCDSPNFIIEKCEPPEFLGHIKVNEKLEVKPNVYAAGDIIDGWPKLGELAMRSGMYIGKLLSSNNVKEPFKPIFINILDIGNKGLHIRSDIPWGGNLQIIKCSKLRKIMKRFIENYYIIRKGNMGFLYYL
ncbi:hypothetical protein DFR86_05570 [Acidianus sulfidivorans JP7]|uniref:Pyridine nucleotide-disulfide oxidoreductase n=1 Tax=Acidianus sulfidivorans JP7 TaxID=619593 RepID=A0A2U9IM42_9CREN|nr:hypothetical protein [Acidianus sulfidivorans]AWR97082.1 hypothetical protein DFR86_05570 [Acidianus sulfidivorans JP7]